MPVFDAGTDVPLAGFQHAREDRTHIFPERQYCGSSRDNDMSARINRRILQILS